MSTHLNTEYRTCYQQQLSDYSSFTTHALMKKVYEESCRSAEDIHNPDNQVVPDWLKYQQTETDSGEILKLPPVLKESAQVQAILPKRTATRFFTSSSLQLEHLATMLYCANEGDINDWPTEKESGVDLRLIVVAWKVTDLPVGVYRYDARTHSLQWINPAPDQASEARELVLQVEFAYTPVIILITGNLAAASARYGAWGHRQLLLRAGAAGQRLWLSALSLGLAGTVFAGFLQKAASTYAHIDGYHSAGLLAFTAGHQPDHLSVQAQEQS